LNVGEVFVTLKEDQTAVVVEDLIAKRWKIQESSLLPLYLWG
tara:strand:+ start:464 stop:589 length:126 start_codon:yes stop_codon:yes gene_type:complete